MPSSNSHCASGSPSLQKKPTKKSSFLSLRRERKSQDTNTGSGRVASGSHTTSPSSFQALDYEEISRPKISRPAPLTGHRPKSASKSFNSAKEDGLKIEPASSQRREKNSQDPKESLDFPSVADDSNPWPDDDDERYSWARPRSRTGPSGRQDSEHIPFLHRPIKYPFRDSGSSTLSHFEPPPQTPIDDMSFRDPGFTMPVMVAAPVSGVETMDALVDGMNGYDGDDRFSGEFRMSSRSKISKAGYHPLYHPPLPTPPPGVTLGVPRKKSSKRVSSSSEEETHHSHRKHHNRHKNHRPPSSRTASNITVTRSNAQSIASEDDHSSIDEYSPLPSPLPVSSPSPTPSPPPEKSHPPLLTPAAAYAKAVTPSVVAPSISEIIRAHAPPSQQIRSKPALSRRTSYAHSNGHTHELFELPPDASPTEEETDLISRSSVDTIAEEVRRTIRNQARSSVISPLPLRPPSQHGTPVDNRKSFPSPQSEGRRDSSIYSYSTISEQHPLPPLDLSTLTKAAINSPTQTIAQYLRSSRLTTVLKLTRFPHASRESPLTVSLSDLGSPTGTPLIVFLGLGCVRQLMGLYDEMAECLGIRLVTIDRWGLGRTDTPRNKSARGIPEWASVVEEVLDRLKIDQCSVMAHSAGAPYALAFANKYPERIRGDVCLLAPWVGSVDGAGYKWLKYVPNGILKTAQAAEWKVQAWMLGKPPTIAYEGIGFDVKQSHKDGDNPLASPPFEPHSFDEPRRSTSSGLFSDYDDLRDFDGRFDSRSTLGRHSTGSQRGHNDAKRDTPQHATRRKPSKGLLGRLKGGIGGSHPPQEEQRPSSSSGGTGKRLKALRSMGSLKGRSSSTLNSKKSFHGTPSLPPKEAAEIGLGLDGVDWSSTIRGKSSSTLPYKSLPSTPCDGSSVDISEFGALRGGGRRSMSFGPTRSQAPPVPPLPSSPPNGPSSETSYQAALGNALIAASHAESSKGTHEDLVQILNHDRQPWGFSYTAYPHTVRVWYGDKDERIAENVVRWMENTMGPDKCIVKVVKGADHALMFKSSIVVEVMEHLSECWKSS
ncbi:hypothetical protein C8Q75DRAFT_773693 [Abortiporus biennis]|nr:hypothetical protein C8Q75DRAFT_773693 [Abortiporus biennis]